MWLATATSAAAPWAAAASGTDTGSAVMAGGGAASARLDSLEGSVGSVQQQMQRTADMVEKVLDAILHQDS